MSIYPVFDINSIICRFNIDINKFNKTYQEVDKTKLELIISDTSLNTKSKLTIAINPIINYLHDNLNKKDYVDEISHKDWPIQNQLWIARTYLFYQLLIFTTVILQNKTLYDEVFIDKEIFPYRDDIPVELINFTHLHI
jgi:hypothetical protein